MSILAPVLVGVDMPRPSSFPAKLLMVPIKLPLSCREERAAGWACRRGAAVWIDSPIYICSQCLHGAAMDDMPAA